MKRLVVLLLVLSVLLSGCVGLPKPTETTAAPDVTEAPTELEESLPTEPTTEATEPPETVPPEKEHVLLEGAEPLGGNLFRVSIDTMVSGYSHVLSCGEDILLVWLESDGEFLSRFCMRLVDHADGASLADTVLSVWGESTAQVWGDTIVLCDSRGGVVYLLDRDFNIMEEKCAPANMGANWYLGSDLNTLYQFTYDGGFIAIDLATGTSVSVLENAKDLSVWMQDDRGVSFSYLDLTTQQIKSGYLDLQLCRVETLPFDGNFGRLWRSGDTWLANDPNTWSTYYLGSSEDPYVIENMDASYILLPGGHLMAQTADGRELYTLQGQFITSCTYGTDAAAGWIDGNMLWSEAYNGYFLFRGSMDGAMELLFWDIGLPAEGEDLQLPLRSAQEKIPYGTAVSEELYARAAAMSEQYGVEIYVADQCKTDFYSFHVDIVTDEAVVITALNVLEDTLAQYPEGFFEQLDYGYVSGVKIYLVGILTQQYGFGSGHYAGFADIQEGSHVIAVNSMLASEVYFHHEISHIIDKRLEWDSYCREGAMFSEAQWNTMNPADFAYHGSYDTFWNEHFDDGYDAWFVDQYSRISATEDRARLFESAACGFDWAFTDCAGRQEKMAYYSACIRDAFDTTGWPEVLPWEATLQSLQNG